MPRTELAALAVIAALVGCGSCEGEHAQHVAPPRPAIASGDAGAGTAGAVEASAGTSVTPASPSPSHELGFLDAPPGTLDGLYTGLAAAERGDPSGRVLLLFFGDSHTAGDSMTSRLRVTWQQRFGDAGRGLVGAG